MHDIDFLVLVAN